MADLQPSSIDHGTGPEAPDHEHSDVNVRAIFTFGGSLIVAAIVIQAMIWLLFQFFSGREAVRSVPEYPLAAGQTRVPPEPRLQTDPRADLRDLRDHESTVLANYGWVDKAAGVVRIPIDEAMRLTVQRGLPTRPPAGDAAK